MNSLSSQAGEIRFLPTRKGSIFALLMRPSSDAKDCAVVVLPAGSYAGSTLRDGYWTRVCRHLAIRGFHAVLLDYHGTGESAGEIEQFWLDRPFVDDTHAVVSWMRGEGIERVVLLGSCFGARSALAYAQSSDLVSGLILHSVPPRDFNSEDRSVGGNGKPQSVKSLARRALQPRRLRALVNGRLRRMYLGLGKDQLRLWAGRLRSRSSGSSEGFVSTSRSFIQPLSRVIRRRVPLLFIYGTEDEYYRDFERAQVGKLGTLLNRASSFAEVKKIPGQAHGLNLRAQQETLDLVDDWLARSYEAARAAEQVG